MEHSVKMQVQEKFEKMFGGGKKSKNDSSNSLQRFLDVRRDPSSRFKHLRFVIESIGDTGERKSFVEQHAFETFHLFHELMCQIESISLAHAAGPRLAVQELECAFWLLESIFCYLPEMIAQRWQYNAIASVMKQFLHPQNFLGLRRYAMRLFLQWYQILAVGPHGCPELDAYFGSLVPHLVLINNDGGAKTTTDRYLTELCEQSYVKNVRRPTNPIDSSSSSSIGAVSYLAKKPTPFPTQADKSSVAAAAANAQATKSASAQSSMEKVLEYISADITKIEWSGNRTEIQKRCLRLLMEKLRRHYVAICVTDSSSTQFDVFHPKLSSATSSNSISSSPSTNGALSMNPTSTNPIDDPLVACRHALIRWVAAYAFSHKKASDSLNNTNNNAAEGSFGVAKDGTTGIPQSPSPRSGDAKIPPNFELIRECLFGSKPMVNFVFSMFRESFLLPLSYASTMGRVFKTLREWLFVEERPIFFSDPISSSSLEPFAGLQNAYMSIIYVLSSFFANPYLYKDEDRATLIVQISAKVLALFKYMACNSCQLSPETWQYLLRSLIDIVQKNVPVSPPPISSMDTTANPTLVQRLSGHLFQTLLIAWVYGGLYSSVSNEMWDELLETLSARTSWPELISEWGKVVDSVTRALGVAVYNVDTLDLPLERLSEQKMIKRQGASRGQIPEKHDTQHKTSTNAAASAAPSGSTQQQGDGSGLTAKPMYDFVQGSPMSNGPNAAQQQLGNGQSTAHRHSDVSITGTVRKTTAGAILRQMTSSAGTPSQLQSPEEASLDGSNSMDSSAPSNDCDGQGEPRESLFDNELLAPTSGAGEDGDDSVSEEFTTAEDSRAIGEVCDADNVVEDESVVADCGPATVYVVWRRILGCLGDVNQIQKPELHLGCLQSLEQLVENLNKIKENQNVDVERGQGQQQQQSITPPAIVPQQTVVATWLLNALHLSERYYESKIIAMRLLCRTMINQYRVAPSIDRILLAQFYAVLHDSLISGVEELAGTIITECGSNIFSNVELGNSSTLLLCDFVRGAGLLLSSDAASRTDRISASRFLSSIACLSSALVNHCPCIANDWEMKKVQCGIIQKEIVLLLRQLAKSSVEREIKIESVKGIGFYLVEQLSRGGGGGASSDDQESEESFQLLLEILPFGGPDVGLLVCNVLQPLCEFLSSSSSKKVDSTWRIVEAYTSALELSLRDLTSFKYGHNTTELQRHEQYATRLALDLIDWCISLPLQNTASKRSESMEAIWKLVHLCYESLSRNGGHDVQKTACTISSLLLTFLTSRFNQGGATQSSSIKEQFATADDQSAAASGNNSGSSFVGKPLVLSSRKNAVFSMQQRQGGHESTSRLLFRHGGGRRCWDMVDTGSNVANKEKTLGAFDSWLSSTMAKNRSDNDSLTSSGKKSNASSIVELRDSNKDALDRLMRHLNTTSPECFANQIRFDQSISDYCFTTLVNEETISAAIGQLNLKFKSPSAAILDRKSRMAKLNQWIVGSGSDFAGYKFLLGSSGLLNWDSHVRMELSALDNSKSERLQRELKHLDGLLLTEAHKIAVLYVADGQEDKQSILANRHGSSAFEDFVAALGWEVDLKHHSGYAGGLSADVHGSTTYYSTATTETVFHVSTRLPNDDPTKNLRHLGNDEVHIVWSEHWRDYRRSIIATEFCDVLIVIYPLEKIPFYKVRIEKKSEEIGEFGPLTDGMLVPWPILATMVRSTAINASRAKRTSVASYKNFFEHRFDSFNQTVERLQAQSSYSNLLSSILKTTNEGGGENHQHQNHRQLQQQSSSNQAHKALIRSS